MTRIQRVIFNAGAWMPRPTPMRAIMPISVTVEGDTSALVPDLCHELCQRAAVGCLRRIDHPGRRGATWNHHGGERRARLRRACSSAWTPTRPAPEYVESNAKPDVSEVRLILTQPDDERTLTTWTCSSLGVWTCARCWRW